MTHYRVAFFEALRRVMPHHGLELSLAYGAPTDVEARKNDSADLDWAHRLPTRYALGGRVCWQPYAHLMRDVQAVVITHENKLLNNLPTQFTQSACRVIFWGHGGNLQGHPDSWRERFKRRVARHADWWLGYTEMSRGLIDRSGFPAERVTILNNSVDTVEMVAMHDAATAERQAAAAARIGLQGSRIGVFVGSLYEDKRIAFLLDAAQHIRDRLPDFELVVMGTGPQRALVERYAADHPWVHYLGVCKGQDKVDVLACCRAMLNPGLVGLGILDAFVCRVPIVTTDCGLHSPEIAYLQHGVNGLMTQNAMGAYVDRCVQVLSDDAFAQTLRDGCRRSSADYTVENMAGHFAHGVAQCLAAPAWR